MLFLKNTSIDQILSMDEMIMAIEGKKPAAKKASKTERAPRRKAG